MRVSVGIPFMNSEATLADAIRSVFAQTFSQWELILIDDGSEDESLRIAMAVDDLRVTVLSDGRNRGLQTRLNEIARLARGDYIARMDADDLMHPERLARQVAFLDANPAIDLVGTATYVIDSQARPIGVRHTEPVDTSPGAVLACGLICHPTSMARAEWCARFPYDETFPGAEDHELYCRAAPKSGFARLREPLFYYREAHKDPHSFLRSYVTHARFLRKCYRMYGPEAVGWPGTVKLMARSHLKSGVYRLATYLGVQEEVIGRRNGRPLTEAERRAAQEGLDAVRRAAVPGLDCETGRRGIVADEGRDRH
jgi:glycosyltransferase involved in cell wall biosynthesis